METDSIKRAKDIIENNQYLTIASSDSKGNSWASPVTYAYDKNYNFYWVSFPKSKHQQNIKINPKVVLAVYDSHQLWGEGIGVQVEAVVEEVSLKDLPSVLTLYFARKYPYGNSGGNLGEGLRKLLSGKIYKFYKAVPSKFWIPDPNSDIDSRIEVNLKD